MLSIVYLFDLAQTFWAVRGIEGRSYSLIYEKIQPVTTTGPFLNLVILNDEIVLILVKFQTNT